MYSLIPFYDTILRNDKKSVSSEKNNITNVKDDNNKEEDKKDEPQTK